MGSLDSCWLPHQEASAATHFADISDTCPEPTLAVPPTRSSMAWPLRDGAVDWLGDKGCIPMVHRLIDGSSIPIHRFERIKGQEFRTSSFRRASCQPVAGLRSRPVEKTACHCGDWKAPPCPIVIGSVSPLRSSISNSGASWGETPLSPVRSMLSSSQRMAVRVHRRETLGWPVLLSLALHLTLFLSLLIIPPTQPPTSASEPLTVDVIMGEGPAEATSEPPAPTEAPPRRLLHTGSAS